MRAAATIFCAIVQIRSYTRPEHFALMEKRITRALGQTSKWLTSKCRSQFYPLFAVSPVDKFLVRYR